MAGEYHARLGDSRREDPGFVQAAPLADVGKEAAEGGRLGP